VDVHHGAQGTGETLGPGEIDLTLEAGQGAVLAISPEGRTLRGLRYSEVFAARLGRLADGTLELALACDGVLAENTANERRVDCAQPGMFVARLTQTLEVSEVIELPTLNRITAAELSRDGSIAYWGYSHDASALDTGVLDGALPTPDDPAAAHVVKLGPDGAVAWVVQIASANPSEDLVLVDRATLVEDGSGWIVGRVVGTGTTGAELVVTTGAGDLQRVPIDLPADVQTNFAARISTEGHFSWAIPVWGADGIHIAATSRGALLSGSFSGTLTIEDAAGSRTTADSPVSTGFFARLTP
jgi:hypothetical protein